MQTLKKTHLTLAKTHSKPNQSSELLISMLIRRWKGALARRTYFWPSVLHSRQLSHHLGRQTKTIQWNWLMLTLENTQLTLAQSHTKPSQCSELLIYLIIRGRKGAPARRTYLWPSVLHLRQMSHHQWLKKREKLQVSKVLSEVQTFSSPKQNSKNYLKASTS